MKQAVRQFLPRPCLHNIAHSPKDVFGASVQAAGSLGWELVSADEQSMKLVARTRASIRQSSWDNSPWGTTVTTIIGRKDGRTLLQIKF